MAPKSFPKRRKTSMRKITVGVRAMLGLTSSAELSAGRPPLPAVPWRRACATSADSPPQCGPNCESGHTGCGMWSRFFYQRTQILFLSRKKSEKGRFSATFPACPSFTASVLPGALPLCNGFDGLLHTVYSLFPELFIILCKIGSQRALTLLCFELFIMLIKI